MMKQLALAATILAGGVGIAGAQTMANPDTAPTYRPPASWSSSGSTGGAVARTGGGAGEASGDDRGEAYTRALNVLQAHGYTGILGVRSTGDGYIRAEVSHDGRREVVRVDPVTGAIRPAG